MKKLLNQKLLLLIIVVLFWFSQYVYIPFQTPYLTIRNVSSNMIGIIIGAYGVSQCLLRLPVGLFADSISKNKLFILCGIIFTGLASIIRVIFPGGYGFLIANILSGVSSSMWISYMVHFTNFFSSDKQQKATSTIILVNNLGMLIGFITSTLFYEKLGMKALCIMSIVSAIIGTILALNIKEHETKKINKKLSVKDYLSICRDRRLIFFSLLALIQQGIQMSTTMSFTNQILEDLGATSVFVGLSSIFYMLCAVASSWFASSRLCNKYGPKFWIPTVFFLISIYCIFVPNVQNIYIIFLLQSLPGMSTGVLLSYLTSESMKNVPKEKKSTAMGFFQATYAVGMSIFPMIVGKISGLISIRASYLVLSLISVIGIIASYFYYKKSVLVPIKSKNNYRLN
ncbi:MAG: MFS transporter [Clostridium sp.]|nr:MFS transporter [Clostridium sp.]